MDALENTSSTLNNVSNTTSSYIDVIGNEGFSDTTWVLLVVLPIIVVLGSIGNLLAFFVMRKGSLRESSTCFYMAILALADTGMLWSGAAVLWIRTLTHDDINPDEWTNCKLGFFFFYFFAHCSSALLVVMSFEKFCALYFPLKTRTICTVRIAKRVSLVTVLLFGLYNAQIFFTLTMDTDPYGYDYCLFTDIVSDPELYDSVINNVDFVIYSFAPFVLMILINSAIIYKFAQAMRKSNNNRGTESTNQALSKSALKGTAMLITVSITFIILTGPICVTFAITDTPSPELYTVNTILQYLNHSVNGLLYCIVGARFRTELLKTLRQCCCCIDQDERSSAYVSNIQPSSAVSAANGTQTTASPM